MGIGVGIFLIALGAILTWAVDWHVAGLDLHVVGWVLMLCGLAGIILFFVFWNNRRAAGRVAVERRTDYPPAGSTYPAGPTSRTTERVYEDPPL
jgi:Domain of unknown function (DUF6458)